MALFAVAEDWANSILYVYETICMIASFNISSQNVVTILVASFISIEDLQSTSQSKINP